MTDQIPSGIEHLPVTFFAMVMGLGGLAIAWRKAERALGLDLQLSGAVLALAAIVFVVLLGFFVAKIITHPAAVLRAELGHPIQLSFFPAVSLSMILLSIATLIMFEQTGEVAFRGLAWLLLTLVSVIVVCLLYRTLRAVAARGICVPTH